MRKEILFKKGIITALTVAMVTSLAPAIGAGGLKTITAKAEETESHNYNSQGFCTECDAYQSAVLTTDKYDIDAGLRLQIGWEIVQHSIQERLTEIIKP